MGQIQNKFQKAAAEKNAALEKKYREFESQAFQSNNWDAISLVIVSDLPDSYSNISIPELVRYFLRKGTNPNEYKNYSPLSFAARGNCIKTIEVLLRYGANIDEMCGYDYKTPLMTAIYCRQFKVVKYLVENGANIHITNKYGRNAFSESKNEGWDKTSKEILKKIHAYLLEQGAQESQNTRYMQFVYDGNLDIIKSFSNNGHDNEGFNEANHLGTTALDRAEEMGNEEIYNFLLQHGAKHGTRIKMKPNPPLRHIKRDIRKKMRSGILPANPKHKRKTDKKHVSAITNRLPNIT